MLWFLMQKHLQFRLFVYFRCWSAHCPSIKRIMTASPWEDSYFSPFLLAVSTKQYSVVDLLPLLVWHQSFFHISHFLPPKFSLISWVPRRACAVFAWKGPRSSKGEDKLCCPGDPEEQRSRYGHNSTSVTLPHVLMNFTFSPNNGK